MQVPRQEKVMRLTAWVRAQVLIEVSSGPDRFATSQRDRFTMLIREQSLHLPEKWICLPLLTNGRDSTMAWQHYDPVVKGKNLGSH